LGYQNRASATRRFQPSLNLIEPGDANWAMLIKGFFGMDLTRLQTEPVAKQRRAK
jgi:hypothetical protein